MSSIRLGRRCAAGGHSRWPLFGAAAAILLVVGAGGARAAGGALDPSFGRGGKVLTDLGIKSDDEGRAVALQRDGKIVVAGGGGDRDGSAVVRYTTGGKPDSRFGTGGKALTDLSGLAIAVAVQADGKIVAVGGAGEIDARDFALVRYTIRGKLDASFGSGGKVLTDVGGEHDDAFAVAVQHDGKIVVAGGSDARGSSDFALVRYSISGKLDASFGMGGKVLTDLGTKSADVADAVVVQPDGKIVVSGGSDAVAGGNQAPALVRYTTGGMLDRSFGSGGKVLTGIGNTSDEVTFAVAVQPDGNIVVAGGRSARDSWDIAVIRYTAAGGLDSSFGTGGKVLTYFGAESNEWASAVAVQPDGKIVVVGGSDARGSYDFALVRYTTTGRLDGGFGKAGKVLTDLGGHDQANSIAVQRDGKIIAAGLSDANGSPDFALVRYAK